MAHTSRSTRIASDGLDAALGIYLVVYSVAAACFALGLYALLQPSKSPNPGTAAYNPPPGTIVSYVAPTHSRTPPETDGRAAAAAEPASTTGLADPAANNAAKEIAKEVTKERVKSDAPARTDDAKPEVKTEAKQRHSAHRERRRPEWGYPSFFDQRRPWY
jgi:hypothetical protein